MRLPELLQQKMGLHEISRELQLRVCNQSQPHASLLRVREQNSFIEGKRKVGKGGIEEAESVAFDWLSPCQERRQSSSFLLG